MGQLDRSHVQDTAQWRAGGDKFDISLGLFKFTLLCAPFDFLGGQWFFP